MEKTKPVSGRCCEHCLTLMILTYCVKLASQ
jgi:hypothetical protein